MTQAGERAAVGVVAAAAVAALSVIATERAALAQTSAFTGMIVAASDQCLQVGAPLPGAAGAPARHQVALAPCDGRPAQRWFVVMGDWNYTRSVGGLCLSYRNAPSAGGPPGVIELVGEACPSSARRSGLTLSGRSLRTPYDDQCVELRGTPGAPAFALARCSGAAAQRWEGR